MSDPSRLAIAACLDALNGPFLKAVTERVRVDVLKIVIVEGRADVGTVAAQLPQDRSVVARHLQVLETAGVVTSQTEGRHRYYQLDGNGVLDQMGALLELFRELTPLCCPSEPEGRPTE